MAQTASRPGDCGTRKQNKRQEQQQAKGACERVSETWVDQDLGDAIIDRRTLQRNTFPITCAQSLQGMGRASGAELLPVVR